MMEEIQVKFYIMIILTCKSQGKSARKSKCVLNNNHWLQDGMPLHRVNVVE